MYFHVASLFESMLPEILNCFNELQLFEFEYLSILNLHYVCFKYSLMSMSTIVDYLQVEDYFSENVKDANNSQKR